MLRATEENKKFMREIWEKEKAKEAMPKAQYEEKFIVINRKYLHIDVNRLSGRENEAIENFVKSLDGLNRLNLLPKNKYYVCNQDEPYASGVIHLILEGETKKLNKI